MSTTDIIARQIVNIDPTLRAPGVLDALPGAQVQKLRDGCIITIKVKEPDAGIVPDILLQFDSQSRIVLATWRQTFEQTDAAFDLFESLERVARRHMLVRPTQDVRVGSRKVRSSFGYTWRISGHQHLSLQAVQPRLRTISREIALTHRLAQSEAMVATTPALWGGPTS